MTDPLGSAQVMPYLLKLSESGHEIFLLSFEKNARFGPGKERIESLIAGQSIHWIPAIYTSKPPVLSTLKDLRKALNIANKIRKENKIDCTHCRSYIAALVGYSLKKKHGIPFIFDMRGFWADERMDGGLWKASNPVYRMIYRYFRKKETLFFNESAHIISLTETGKEIILSRNYAKVYPEKITVIPCCTDTDLFCPQTDHPALAERRTALNINGAFPVISYLGSFGTWYMGGEMFDFFRVFQKTYPRAVFLIITRDDPKPVLQLARDHGISGDSLRIVPAERNEVPLLLSLSQATLFFILPVFSKKASSPTKMGEALSLGIPVICNDGIGDCSTILEKEQAGLIINDFSEKSYQKVFQQFDDLLKIPPSKIRALAIEKFDLRTGVVRYLQVYQSIENPRS